MTRAEAIIYFKQCNSRIVSVCKDENEYDYEKQEIISDCARKTYEANKLALEALKQEPILDKIRAEIEDEKEYAYADFEQYKIDYLGVDAEYVEDELPYDDFRYGMGRAIEIIDKYKARK